MASTYSPNLRLELIGTGEQQGTWGITTNTNLGTLLEEAIGGYISVAVTDGADTTLTTNNGSADQSRNMVINLTGALTASRNVICPAIEKMYVVKNATTGGQAITFKVSGQTGVSIPNGSTYILYVNGTDAALASGTIAAQNSNNVSITGGSLSGITSITVAAGSNTAPSITTTGDTNTGIYFPAADTIAFTEGGTEAMRIDSSGRVLIGTTSPASGYVLQPYGKIYAGDDTDVTPNALWSGQLTIRGNGYSGGLSLDATGMWVGHSSAVRALLFATDETERMRIDSSGNVGIGTTSPSTFGKLAVTGSATKTIGVSVASSGSTASPAETNLISAWTSGGLYQAGIFSVNTFTSDFGNALTFKTTDTAGTTAERMRIDASGNVGIGTSSPSQKLTVSVADTAQALQLRGATGYLRIRPYVDATNGTIIDSTNAAESAYAPLTLSGSSLRLFGGGGSGVVIDSSGNVGVGTTDFTQGSFATKGAISINAASAAKLSWNNSGVYLNWIECGGITGANYMRFATANAEAMRIDSSGNVLIGGTSPVERLSVIGPSGGTSALFTDNVNSTLRIKHESPGNLVTYESGGAAQQRWVTNGAERMRIDSSGNVGIGTSTFGTSAAKVLSIGTGTAPSTGPADTIQIFSTDLSAGNTILSLRTEGTPVNANTTAAATHRIAVRINGTVYYLLANTAA